MKKPKNKYKIMFFILVFIILCFSFLVIKDRKVDDMKTVITNIDELSTDLERKKDLLEKLNFVENNVGIYLKGKCCSYEYKFNKEIYGIDASETLGLKNKKYHIYVKTIPYIFDNEIHILLEGNESSNLLGHKYTIIIDSKWKTIKCLNDNNGHNIFLTKNDKKRIKDTMKPLLEAIPKKVEKNMILERRKAKRILEWLDW